MESMNDSSSTTNNIQTLIRTCRSWPEFFKKKHVAEEKKSLPEFFKKKYVAEEKMESMNESSPINCVQLLIAIRRPWPEFFDITSFTLPPLTVAVSTARIKRNLRYFFSNYIVTMLLLFLVSLLWHPVWLVSSLIVFVAWYFYLVRDDPLTLFNYAIDDAVLKVMCVATVRLFVLTSIWLNVLASLLIGAGVICLHGAVWSTNDLVGDDQESPFHTMLPADGDSHV